MGTEARRGRFARWLNGRVQRKGLRPRLAAFVVMVLWSVAVVVFAVVERLVDPDTFPNVWLAIWWALQTVTTVGYGDVVPGQTAGKVVASVLMLGGLSLLAVVTGAITSVFVTRAQDERRSAGEDPVMQRLDGLAAELEAIRVELARAGPGADSRVD